MKQDVKERDYLILVMDRFQAVERQDTKRITISAQSTSTLDLVTVSGLLCPTLTGVLSTVFVRGNTTKQT